MPMAPNNLPFGYGEEPQGYFMINVWNPTSTPVIGMTLIFFSRVVQTPREIPVLSTAPIMNSDV